MFRMNAGSVTTSPGDVLTPGPSLITAVLPSVIRCHISGLHGLKRARQDSHC